MYHLYMHVSCTYNYYFYLGAFLYQNDKIKGAVTNKDFYSLDVTPFFA